MSTATTETPATTEPATATNRRNAVGMLDLLWVTWRQHRFMLLATTTLCVLIAALMFVAATSQKTAPGEYSLIAQIQTLAELGLAFLTCFSGLIAVFWVAPLLAREFEAGTHLLVWSQDVAAKRLVWAKTAWLILAALLLSLIIGTAGVLLVTRLGPDTGRMYEPYFSAAPHVQFGYVLFGFALGLLVSALARRTVLAMGVTLAGFLLTRLVTIYLRPYYAPPVRVTDRLDASSNTFPDSYGMLVDSGLLDRAGNPVDPLTMCAANSATQYSDCMRQAGVFRDYTDYHPADRLDDFRLIETGVYVALAAVLFLLAWRFTRRVTRL